MPQHIPSSTLDLLIDKDPDRLLAWREHAPSRQHITSPLGPFATHRILTRGGIFSALVFRAVTFGAPALKHHPGFFVNFAAWLAFYDPSLPLSFYCRTNVYGNGVHRGPQNVAQFWDASVTLLKELQKAPRPSFESIWEHLVKARAENGRMLYPTIGKLVGYLLCVDLVYAGVLDPPTADDIGNIVADIGRGGRAGLVRLKLVRRDATKGEVSSAFQSLHKYLKARFRKHSLFRCLNVFIVENGLCKYERLVKL